MNHSTSPIAFQRLLRSLVFVLATLALIVGSAVAQADSRGGSVPDAASLLADGNALGAAAALAASNAPGVQSQGNGASGPMVSIDLGDDEITNLNTGIELFLFMTLLAFAPAIVMTMTCFPRIVIVLAFLRRAIAIQELPPTTVVTGFAIFLTVFVMMPVIQDLHQDAYQPYVAEEIGFQEAAARASNRMNQFMLRQTREEDIALVLELSDSARPATPADVPFHVVVPAFILSEIKTAFQMGFVLFLPFVVIDLVISAILISMGMFTLPPVVVSTPLKILLFIMVDGWNLVVASLFASFANV